MLLNSHTFIRSFRELQYDLRVFLEAVSRISPVGSSASGIVEAKWSDGSVSVAPVSSLVQAFVGGKFPKLDIGSSSIVPVSTDGGIELRIDAENGVSLKFDNLDADSLNVVSSVINRLVVTSDTHLDSNVLINSLEVTGDVTAILASILAKTTVTNQVMTNSLTAGTLDLTGMPVYSELRIAPSRVEQSSYVYAYNRESTFNDKLIVNGAVCFNNETPTDASDLRSNLVVSYYTPAKPYAEYDLWLAAQYSRKGTLFTIPLVEHIAYNNVAIDNALSDIVCIYPRKYVMLYPANKYVYNVMVDMPRDEDSNKIVQVCNPMDVPRKVCNVWKFTSSIVDNVPRGKVNPTSYVTLPPHSSIDFLFDFDLLSDSVYAYMLPMSILE